MAALDVPDLVRQRARANGSVGQQWLDGLAEVVGTLAADWRLALGPTLRGGTAAYVAAATDDWGRPCVLKVAMPMEIDGAGAFERSVLVHRLAEGRGCATLLRHTVDPPAMLLERLGANLDELGLSLPDLLRTVAETLQSFWRPVAADCALPTGADKAAWLAEHITRSWESLGRPCSQRVVARAVQLCDERGGAFATERAVLVHGDAHGWNTLRAGQGEFKFVDPEGLRSDPAHDLGVPMREYNRPLLDGDTARLVRERAERLGTLCDVDPDAVWQWGFIERVSTGLLCLREFDNDEGRVFLEVAERCL